MLVTGKQWLLGAREAGAVCRFKGALTAFWEGHIVWKSESGGEIEAYSWYYQYLDGLCGSFVDPALRSA